MNKYGLDGQLVWSRLVHVGGCWDCATGLTMTEENELFLDFSDWQETAFMRYDANGALLDSVTVEMDSIQGFAVFADYFVLGHSGETLNGYDSDGEVVDSMTFQEDIQEIQAQVDSLLVLCTDSLYILNSDLENVSTVGFEIDGELVDVESASGQLKIIAKDEDGLQIIELDTDLTVVDITEVTTPILFGFDMDIEGDHLTITEPYPLILNRSVRYRDYDLTEGQGTEIPHADAEPIAIEVNESLVNYSTSGGLTTIGVDLDVSVLVKNNGDAPMTSCRFNHFIAPSFCSYVVFTAEVDDLAIPVGDSAWVDLGWTGYSVESFPETDTVSYTYCLYTSNPNGVVDLNVPNDEYCETFDFLVTDIGEHEARTLSFYPNPVSDRISILGTLPVGSTYVISDMLGRSVQSGAIVGETIDLSAISEGQYIIEVSSIGRTPYVSTVLIDRH